MIASGCGAGPDAGESAGMAVTSGGVLTGVKSGLLVRQIRVVDRPQAIFDALLEHAEDFGLDETTRALLERNGMRLVRVPIDRMEDLRRDLGDASIDVEGWHGQALDWREIASHAVGSGATQAVALDGRIRVLAGGRLTMMMRGWTMPMEDGPTIYVEMRAVHDSSRPNRVERMLGRRAFRGEPLEAARLDVQMNEGFAYVLVAAAPGVDLEDLEGDDANARGAGFGPDAPVPPTVGELLLIPETEPPQRDLLLFVPAIPAELFPPEADGLAKRGASP